MADNKDNKDKKNRTVIKLNFVKSTKRMHRFAEEGDIDDQIIRSLYVSQDVFDKEPKGVKVVIEPIY